MRRALVGIIGLATLSVLACNRGVNTKSAVEKAVRAHLERNSNLALNAFTTEVSDVKFNGDNAEAMVRFKSKQAPEMSVQVKYTLHKEADNWVVQSSSGMGHGEMPMAGGQGTNPHEGIGIPTTPPPTSQPQPAPSH